MSFKYTVHEHDNVLSVHDLESGEDIGLFSKTHTNDLIQLVDLLNNKNEELVLIDEYLKQKTSVIHMNNPEIKSYSRNIRMTMNEFNQHLNNARCDELLLLM